MICEKCSVNNAGDSKFCRNCGCAIVHDENNLTTYIGYLNTDGILCELKTHLPLRKFKAIENSKYFKVALDSEVLFEIDDDVVINLRSLPALAPSFETFDVRGGDYPADDYSMSDDQICLISTKDRKVYVFLAGAKIEKITEERAQEKFKSVMIGSVGAIATLGVGLAVGVMHAAKKFYLLEVTLTNGKFLILKCRPKGYEQLLLAAHKPPLFNVKLEHSFNVQKLVNSDSLVSTDTSILDKIISPKTRSLIGSIIIVVLVLIFIMN